MLWKCWLREIFSFHFFWLSKKKVDSRTDESDDERGNALKVLKEVLTTVSKAFRNYFYHNVLTLNQERQM